MKKYSALIDLKFIRERMSELGLRPVELAERIGMSPEGLRNVLSGRRGLRVKWIPRMAEALQVDQEALYDKTILKIRLLESSPEAMLDLRIPLDKQPQKTMVWLLKSLVAYREHLRRTGRRGPGPVLLRDGMSAGTVLSLDGPCSGTCGVM